MKAQVGVEVQLHTVLASVLHRREWLASYSATLYPDPASAEGEVVLASDLVWTLLRTDKSLPLPGIKLMIPVSFLV